jgi:hypothetical protein
VPSNSSGSANNTAWTGFFGAANQTNMHNYMPSPCGGGVAPPEVKVGDRINITNGEVKNLLDDVQCLLNNGINRFVVPVIQSTGSTCSGPMNQSQPVVGFVTLVVDSVKATGNPKYMSLHAVFNGAVAGDPGGCSKCGTGHAVLVN